VIARKARISEADVSFMAGLLHDIGRMVIDTYFPDEPEMEHTEVGAWMAERWQLPEPLVNAIAFHHSVAPEHLAQPIIACVHAADACAKIAFTVDAPPLEKEVLEALKLTEPQFLEIVQELRGRKMQMERLLL
jgi:putative nucleotidyltransferase with HDIG domain